MTDHIKIIALFGAGISRPEIIRAGLAPGPARAARAITDSEARRDQGSPGRCGGGGMAPRRRRHCTQLTRDGAGPAALGHNPTQKSIENMMMRIVENESFTFEIDSENAMLDCTLER